MADEVRLWQIGAEEQLIAIDRAPLNLESRLQEWLARDISVLDPTLLVIGREVETDYGGFIDILCVDAAGDLVIVELKRDKTPREVTAQALDYASWVVNLSNERVTSIANEHLDDGFETAFRTKFGTDVPETLNGDHRVLVVGSEIDASSERIIRYLSDAHGVSINAATFQYFRLPEGSEVLARVFLIEPSEVELKTRTKGSSKRRPNLSYEELNMLASEAGVGELYDYAVSAFEGLLQKHTTRSSIGFASLLDGSRKTVISLLPGESSAGEGLRYRLYKNRYAELAKVHVSELASLLPLRHDDWVYGPADAGPDWLDRYKQRVRPSTLKRRREALRALVAIEAGRPDPFGLAGMRLDRITTAVVEDAVAVIGERAPRQAQLALATLKLALRNARERGQVIDPQLLAIAAPESDEREPIFLTWHRVLDLASSMPEQISRIVPVAALTGAREGELFALRADDIDLAEQTLLVVSTGSNRRGQTKTRGSKRTIDLPPLAAQLLREQLLARWNTSNHLVFPAPEGGVWNKDNFTARVFRPAVQKAVKRYQHEHQPTSHAATPFDGLTFHDLRHTCASLMIAAANHAGAGQAVTIKSIAEQLGHTDGGVLVLRRYGHLFKGARRQAALALDRYVRAG